MLPANFSDFVVFLGTPAFVGFLTAHILILLPAYVNLPPMTKQIVTIVLNAIFAIVSLLLVSLVNPQVFVQFQPVYAIIAAFIMSWIGNQTTLNGLMLNRLFVFLDK